jgi:hypothetical protein
LLAADRSEARRLPRRAPERSPGDPDPAAGAAAPEPAVVPEPAARCWATRVARSRSEPTICAPPRSSGTDPVRGRLSSAGAVLISSTAMRPPPVAPPATTAIARTLAARPFAPAAASRPADAPEPAAPPPAAAPAARLAAPAAPPERAGLQRHRRRDGQDDRHRSALALQLGLERRAGGADIDVPAQVGAPQRAATQHGELLLDLAAVGVARLAGVRKRLASLEHEGLDLVLAHVEGHGDLLVRERAELGEHERGPLVVREALEVGEHVAEVLALLDLGREAFDEGSGTSSSARSSRRARRIDRERLRAIV